MTLVTQNLGQIGALYQGSSAPSNTTLIWYDTNVSRQKYYNVATGTWDILGGSTLLDFSVRIPSAQVRTAYDTKVLLIAPPGAGLEIDLITSTLEMDYNSIPYDTNVHAHLIIDTATQYQHIFLNVLDLANSSPWKGYPNLSNPAASDTMLIADKGLYFYVPVGNPQNGNSDVIISGTYRLKRSQS